MTSALTASRSSRPIFGVMLMLGAMASLPFIDVLAKKLGQQEVPILQIVWARMCFGALLTLPLALRHVPFRGLAPKRPIYHFFRASLLIAATFSFFLALKFLPIADALAIFFVQPLIVTALSPLILKEKVGARRWTAVLIGFVGTLIIIRPGFVQFNPGTVLALAAGSFLAIYFLMTRRISGTAPAMVTTFQTNAMGTMLTCLALPLFWEMPTAEQWVMFAALGGIATFGHFLIVRAYDHAEASLLAPLAYSEMIMATTLGWLVFGDLPDRYTVLGVAILIGCAIFISVREMSLRPAVKVPPDQPPML